MLGQTGTMGIKPSDYHPGTPTVTQSVTSSTETLILTNCEKKSVTFHIDTTLKRGQLLGVLKPVWIKTTESEENVR